MSELKLKSIYDLLGKNYFIPSYQRGYRWDKRQIKDLLEDLYGFADDNNTEKGDFYCLQPIVVKVCDAQTIEFNNLKSELDNNTWYEVIDGQQRLITIYLLFKYLIDKGNIDLASDYGAELYKIYYQTHEKGIDYISSPSAYCEDSPNAYYFTNGYQHISKWFEALPETKQIPQTKRIRDRFLTLLTSTKDSREKSIGYVQVIWYETDEGDPIKTFTRLNIGKIPLNNAELIKALFLQKRDETDVSKIQQIQIAKEWDQIEATLQNKRLWAFLNKGMPDTPTHIEYIFDVVFSVDGGKEIIEFGNESYKQKHEGKEPNLNSKAQKAERDELGKKRFADKYGSDEYASFRFFSERFVNADRTVIEEQWDKIKEYYETFKEWYYNPLWYHYIGFLIYCGKPITEIYELYNGKTKKEFADSLVKKIRDTLKVQYKSVDDVSVDITHNNESIVYSNKTKEILRQLLVLYNIEFIVQKNEGLSSGYIVFPFDLFKSEEWDIEHVDSFTTNPLTDAEQQKEWLSTALDVLKEYGIDYQNTEKITKSEAYSLEGFLSELRTGVSFDDVKLIVSKLAGEYLPTEEVHKDIKNSIGNLTLLNADINRGYGNAIFPSKKKEITIKDAQGRFIPLCTKNVFLKNFIGVNNTSISWNEKDMERHRNDIIKVIRKFLIEESKEAE